MEPESNNNNKALHTLADDMALALTKNEGGIVKKIIEEEEKKEEEKKKRELYKMRNRVYIVLAILFLIAAGVTVSIVFFKENPISFFIQKRFTPIIFHEGTEIIDISNNDKEEISDKINEIILKSNLGKGEILGIYLRDNNKTITFDNFLQKLESPFIYPTGTFEPNFLLGAIKREVKTNIEENKEEQNQDKTPKKILENFVTFSSKDFFVNQKVDFLSEDAKNKMIELIGYFLEIVNLNDDKIQVLGIYPTENKNANSEKEASLYKDFGISFLTEILKSKYKEEELKNLTLGNFGSHNAK
jgi:low affinity Fe/Cu permease